MVELSPAVFRPRKPSEVGRPRYAALDAVRFIAAAAVVAFHYTARTTSSWPEPISSIAPGLVRVTKFGYFGVDLFFVVSGFVILMSAWGRPLPAFVASRISRLYPAYWVSVIITAAVLVLFGTVKITAGQVAVNLTMLQSVVGVPEVDGVYWTLWAEMRFYILIGVFLVVGITTKRILIFAGVWPVLSLLAFENNSHLLRIILVAPYAGLFAGGMLLYLIVRNGSTVIAWLLLAANVLMTVPTAGANAASSIFSTTGLHLSSTTTWLVTVGCFAIVALVVLTPLKRWRWRVLTIAGSLTYPLYLLHEEIGYVIIQHLAPHTHWWVAALVAAATALVLAALVHYLVERPFMPMLRRVISRELERSDDGEPKKQESQTVS
ncbi:acyltransferase [Frondihabitans sucicola]|uniref:Acyltransferase n=1 Tax=Frondihabitans sucicola TaxID=1268041 RepID=A0ABN6Y2X7_9MICO|nr:acyltransferase [Frondihabitans sucicola]BDZ51553.1 acyltransferase [Frondihabitans sucicola]